MGAEIVDSRRLDIVALFGVVPGSVAFQMHGAIFGWFAYVLAFYAFVNASPAVCFRRGMLAGLGAGLINFSWILIEGDRFTGKGFALSVIVIIVMTLVLSIYVGIIAFVYGCVKWKNIPPSSYANLINATILSCIFVLFDSFMIYVADSFSLMMYVSYIFVAQDLYAIQPAALFGPLIITFGLVMFNGLLAHVLFYRLWNRLFMPLLVILSYYSGSLVVLRNFEKQQNSRAPFKAAIIVENIKPEFKWDKANGDKLVENLFKLTRQAVKKNVDLVIWSETVIPWNFSYDDPFLLELGKLTTPHGITNLIGMNTGHKINVYYNSIYCLQPGLRITGRYDKRLALSFLEKPFWGFTMPFLSGNAFQIKEGKSDSPLSTPVGSAGILLCNESTVPSLAAKSAKSGAEFLINPSNDGWFADTYLVDQHFYHARLRAVETRRDIVVNSNSGFAGKISASGVIEQLSRNNKSGVCVVSVRPSSYTSFAVKYPSLFPALSGLFLLFFLVLGLKSG